MNLSNPVFIPGPTNMPEDIRNAINHPTIDHRNPSFKSQLDKLHGDIANILRSVTAQIFIFPATGTGGWEAAIANTLSPGDKVLACSHGVFSNKWIDLCKHFELEVEILECDWRTPANPDLIEAALRRDSTGEIKAVLTTHNETATGVRSDLAAIRGAIDAAGHGALFYVDGVSSIASMQFEMDAWGIDVAVTGSQKGFMLPAGIAIVACSPEAMARTKEARLPRFFFDFQQMNATVEQGGYPYTPPMQLLSGLQRACDLLLAEGLDKVVERHFFIAEGVRQAVSAWGLELCASKTTFASDTVTTVILPEGFNADELTAHAYSRYQMSFGVGLGQFAGRAFRIGHLGYLSEAQALAGLAVIEMAMLDLKYPIKAGAGVAAAQTWYCGRSAQIMEEVA